MTLFPIALLDYFRAPFCALALPFTTVAHQATVCEPETGCSSFAQEVERVCCHPHQLARTRLDTLESSIGLQRVDSQRTL